jgi:hypothetical protein
MHKAILVNRSLEDGEKLIEALDESDFPIVAAFWQHLDEDRLWRLVIVSPLVDAEGPLRTYMHITNALNKLGDSVQFGISDISVIGPSWWEFRDMRRSVESAGVGRIGTSGEPLKSQGVVFEDYYIYRWNPSQLTLA